MYNVTALLDLANNNSAIINALATIVQAGATIGLLVVTYYLWQAASKTNQYAGKQTEVMSKQLNAIENQTQKYDKQNEIMDKQVSSLDAQKTIMIDEVDAMNRDRDFRMKVEKYRRLRDEMDKLVAPLYVNAKRYTDENRDMFDSYIPGYTSAKIDTPLIKANFWNDIQKNSHLSQSENLSLFLQNHFDYNLKYINSNNQDKNKLTDLHKNAPLLINAIIKRHDQLKVEIKEIEIELGIRKHD